MSSNQPVFITSPASYKQLRGSAFLPNDVVQSMDKKDINGYFRNKAVMEIAEAMLENDCIQIDCDYDIERQGFRCYYSVRVVEPNESEVRRKV